MIEAIAKAADISVYKNSAEPFTTPMVRKNALIVGGTHLRALSGLFPSYALTATLVVPSTLVELDREVELERAIQFEDTYPEICGGVGCARDLSGFDSDSLDILFICTPFPRIRDEFLAQAWRVVKEFGKIIVFSSAEIPPSYLGSFGMAAPTYYAAEGFYVGTMRKIASVYARN